VVSLIGWKVRAWPARRWRLAAVCAPSCVLTFAVSRIWQRFRGARWRAAVEDGLVPVTVGLMLAGGYLITLAAEPFMVGFRRHGRHGGRRSDDEDPSAWLFGAAGLIGLAGWV